LNFLFQLVSRSRTGYSPGGQLYIVRGYDDAMSRKERLDGWVDGWMGGWVDGWMGGWIERHKIISQQVKRTDLNLLEGLLGWQIGDGSHLSVDPGLDGGARVLILLPQSDRVLILIAKGAQLGPCALPSLDSLIYHGVDALADLGSAGLAERLRRGSQFAYQDFARYEVDVQALQ
jgi:hypothetical protein